MSTYLYIKRIADFFAASLLILLLLPVFLGIALAIKIESPGPIFYWSKRVGRGFQVFNLQIQINARQCR
jgi:lipopolysaccharide/colanic/teichoic acid biosynthesis glycosyltransferase